MRQWTIKNDKVIDNGEVPYLGTPYESIKNGSIKTLPKDYDGWFPFTRMCNSIGDWGVISGIYEALKIKYPNIKIAIPNNDYFNVLFEGSSYFSRWNYDQSWTENHNMELIMMNNPNIDYRFNAGDFNIVYNDHYRAYDKLIQEDGIIVSDEEPLSEQIVKAFGITNKDLETIDLRPKLYFTDNEINEAKKIISKYGFDFNQYGCLILAGRLDKFKNQWEGDDKIIPYIEKYKNIPVFYFSSWNLEGTFWDNLFPHRVDFEKENIPIRTQLCLKYFATFNTGYQAGLTDSVSGGNSEVIVITPYKSLRENFIRGTRYVYLDGRTKKSPIYRKNEDNSFNR